MILRSLGIGRDDDHSVIRYYLVKLVLMLIAGTDLEFILESQTSYHRYDKLSIISGL